MIDTEIVQNVISQTIDVATRMESQSIGKSKRELDRIAVQAVSQLREIMVNNLS